jgi:hypothetical protein
MPETVQDIAVTGCAGLGACVFQGDRSGDGSGGWLVVIDTPDKEACPEEQTRKYQNRSATIKTSGHFFYKKRRAGQMSFSPSPAIGNNLLLVVV